MRMRGSPGDKSRLRQTMQVVKKRERIAAPVTEAAEETTAEPEGNVVWAVVERFNTAWIEGRPQETAHALAEDAVMVAPGLSGRLEGRAAVVNSIVQYVKSAETRSFDVVDAMIDVMGDAAVVAYTFDVEYARNGSVQRERAQETLVLGRTPKGWKIRWRTQVPLAQ